LEQSTGEAVADSRPDSCRCFSIHLNACGKIIGSLAVNWIRMLFGMIFLSLFTWVTRDMLLPTDADLHAWCWLSISGLKGIESIIGAGAGLGIGFAVCPQCSNEEAGAKNAGPGTGVGAALGALGFLTSPYRTVYEVK
jgi:hypothetical protein